MKPQPYKEKAFLDHEVELVDVNGARRITIVDEDDTQSFSVEEWISVSKWINEQLKEEGYDV